MQNFKSSLAVIAPFMLANYYEYNSSGYVQEHDIIFGLLTNAQVPAALAALNTLNTALGFNVICYTYQVTLEP